jgi:transcriptional regulator with XRE-family HTH domain
MEGRVLYLSENPEEWAIVGERIRKTRESLDMSQTALAGDGLSPSYISLIESGKRRPTNTAIDIICRRLGVQPEDLGMEYDVQEVARLRLPLGVGAFGLIEEGMVKSYGGDCTLREQNGWLIVTRSK